MDPKFINDLDKNKISNLNFSADQQQNECFINLLDKFLKKFYLTFGEINEDELIINKYNNNWIGFESYKYVIFGKKIKRKILELTLDLIEFYRKNI